jgi:hypothetical protein
VRRAFVLIALVVAPLAAGVESSKATSECRGLMICVPVAGPWVAVPAGRATLRRPDVQYQLTCPKGYIVAGVDAELSDRAIDVWFMGATGTPVSPGRTTSRTIVFVARYVGLGAATPTFRPHAGCVPGQGGGSRTPTSLSAVFPPGRPTVRRVRTFRVTSPRNVAVGCRNDERLVAAYSARGFRTAKPPAPALVTSLSARPTVALDHIVVAVRGGQSRGVVQVAAVWAGGRCASTAPCFC